MHEERLHTECPPDAHKVLRQPDNECNALICLNIYDWEVNEYGANNVAELISIFNKKAYVCASENTINALKPFVTEEFTPIFLKRNGNVLQGEDNQSLTCEDFFSDVNHMNSYLDTLAKKTFVLVDTLSMYILKSISTVYPWDKLLASDFVRQYIKAYSALSDKDKKELNDVHYGKIYWETLKEQNPTAYTFLRLERKLYLQYPSED